MSKEKYMEIAGKRGLLAIKYIRMVANMTKNKIYDIDQDTVEKFTDRLHSEVDAILEAYNSRTKQKTDTGIKGIFDEDSEEEE